MKKTNRKNNKRHGIRVLTNATSKHYGKYVVTAGFNSNKILAFGNDPGDLIDQARNLGHKQPMILYIRDPKITYIYSLTG